MVPGIKVVELFDSTLFLVNPSERERGAGFLDPPRRIGFDYSYLADSSPETPKSKWALLFDINGGSTEVESGPRSQMTDPGPVNSLLEQEYQEFDSQNFVNSGKVSSLPEQEYQEFASQTQNFGAGLKNLANSCYINAVLQCFMHTVPFIEVVLPDTHSRQCYDSMERFCLLCALHDLVRLSLTTNYEAVSPSKIVNHLSYFSPTLKRFEQEDAHEFLKFFLDKLESCCDSLGNDKAPSKSDNFVKKVFGGLLVSKLKCCNCGHSSDKYEQSYDLSLGIENVDTLLTALQSFTKVEQIEDSEAKFTCEKCKEKVSMDKQLAFEKVPSIAMFHLKRFKTNGLTVQKIDKHVAFPLHFDVLPFTVTGPVTGAEFRYFLYAVIVHQGATIAAGHYYCFIRLSPNQWCNFDDARVELVNEDFVLSQQAYILFYANDENLNWFSTFMETKKSLIPKPMLVTPLAPRSEEVFDDYSDCEAQKDEDEEDEVEEEVNMPNIGMVGEAPPPITGKNDLGGLKKRPRNEDCMSRKRSRSEASATHQNSRIMRALHPWIARTFRYN